MSSLGALIIVLAILMTIIGGEMPVMAKVPQMLFLVGITLLVKMEQ